MDEIFETTPTPIRSRLLFIDAYDSYSNNIIALLRRETHAHITVIKIDDERFLNHGDEVFRRFSRHFDAAVIGPGPGDPHNAKDTGLIDRVWHSSEDYMLPVLGICLGFQSLILSCGGSVERLKQPRHGIVTEVTHRGESIFRGLSRVHATQYHSLRACLGHEAFGHRDRLWMPTREVPLLKPLAWDFSDEQNGPVLMGVSHISKPFVAVQYHPESIKTNNAGAQIVANWWAEVRSWRASRSCLPRPDPPLSSAQGNDSGYATDEEMSSAPCSNSASSSRTQNASERTATGVVSWTAVDIPSGIDIAYTLCDQIKNETSHHPVLLESGCKAGKPVRSETGRWTIIGLVDDASQHLRWWLDGRIASTDTDGNPCCQQASIDDAFDMLRFDTAKVAALGGPEQVPFWGGYIGYISYEAGLRTLNVPVDTDLARESDVHFVFVQRSIVVDHCQHKAYVQTLRYGDEGWLDHVKGLLQTITEASKRFQEALPRPAQQLVQRPQREGYCAKVEQCQEHIRAGDAYEMCLTEASDMILSCSEDGVRDSWQIYRRLRMMNPAPFGAHLVFDDISIASSSPERFLSWTRRGRCEFRPIKGTVQKTAAVTRYDADTILKSDKEQAENLMIVDLIRHDLNGVLGSLGREAEVSQLMKVEEYETVYQLVSVIRGNMTGTVSPPVTSPDRRQRDDAVLELDDLDLGRHRTTTSMQKDSVTTPTGFDVLVASLPPGSMTGAPKKRACELLQAIEQRRRGLYSGVLGYLDVGGGGDFSVVIRSVVIDDRGCSIGAGGAVTALSDPVAEWEEMMGKSQAVSR